MPKDNIERAIQRGTGEGADAESYEAVLYEGYGPGGVARARRGADRQPQPHRQRRAPRVHASTAATSASPGSVAYLFDKKGVIVVDGGALHRGRPDRRDRRRAPRTSPSTRTCFEVVTEPVRPRRRPRRARGAPASRSSPRRSPSCPSTRVEIDEATVAKLMRLIDTLEDNDDVGDVHANFDADADVLERVAAAG